MTGARRGVSAPVLAVLIVAFALSACGGNDRRPASNGPPTLISAPASAFDSIMITAIATGRTASATTEVGRGLAPLLAARRFSPQGPLSDYGLDKPVAEIDYVRGGAPAERLVVGGADFDAHDFYLQRPGDPAIYLVLSASVRPALELVGVLTPVPS